MFLDRPNRVLISEVSSLLSSAGGERGLGSLGLGCAAWLGVVVPRDRWQLGRTHLEG
jgi:hypothetical protein